MMGMIVPREYGGGFGITSYNRVLFRMVSAHQSIGCGAIILFGTEAQKNVFFPL
nr:acyl-CoA dehydrogenase family protein [Nitrosococcus watsonii]